jgi:hypothetical protein
MERKAYKTIKLLLSDLYKTLSALGSQGREILL